jgi:hypothetical protein
MKYNNSNLRFLSLVFLYFYYQSMALLVSRLLSADDRMTNEYGAVGGVRTVIRMQSIGM